MSSATPQSSYRHAIKRDGFVSDTAQQRAVAALQRCHAALDHAASGPTPCGVYLWGPVGRGKTWLMDLFVGCVQVPVRRQHFHHFMRWVHTRLFQLNGTADPLQALARSLGEEIRVLCFDELFVADIGDAIILGRLFRELFAHGVVIVATSNQPPGQLYADGFNRERFLPAIAAIEQHTHVVEVDGGNDHRQRPGVEHQRYWIAQPDRESALRSVFDQLTANSPDAPRDMAEPEPEPTLGRLPLRVVRSTSTVVWCRFADLCEASFSALDYIELCDRYSAILVGEVPQLGSAPREGRIARGTEDAASRVAAGDRELPKLAARDDAVRRFIALVDECYDRGVPIYLEATVPLEALYTQGYLSFAFRRTLSRLQEMQLQRFAASTGQSR